MNEIRNVRIYVRNNIKMNEIRNVRINVRMNNKNEWDKECKNEY